MVVTSQYRNPLNFNDETLRAARKSLQRIDKLMKAMEDAAGGTSDAAGTDGGTDGAINMAEECERALSNFELAMTDDMNTPRAVAAMFGLVGAAEKRVKRGGLGSAEAAQVRDTLRAMDEVFGVFYDVPVAYFSPQEETGDTAIPEIVVEMAEQRRLAKANKQYQEADELRAKIQGAGFEIKDKKDGYELIPC
jgi:cysteinyl-tRNA synthetase